MEFDDNNLSPCAEWLHNSPLSGDRLRQTLNYNSHIVFIKLMFSAILPKAKKEEAFYHAAGG
jgi:hypothetical protein